MFNVTEEVTSYIIWINIKGKIKFKHIWLVGNIPETNENTHTSPSAREKKKSLYYHFRCRNLGNVRFDEQYIMTNYNKRKLLFFHDSSNKNIYSFFFHIISKKSILVIFFFATLKIRVTSDPMKIIDFFRERDVQKWILWRFFELKFRITSKREIFLVYF